MRETSSRCTKNHKTAHYLIYFTLYQNRMNKNDFWWLSIKTLRNWADQLFIASLQVFVVIRSNALPFAGQCFMFSLSAKSTTDPDLPVERSALHLNNSNFFLIEQKRSRHVCGPVWFSLSRQKAKASKRANDFTHTRAPSAGIGGGGGITTRTRVSLSSES